ncbi:MAG TPA: hypothetical protein VFK32_07935 [Tepidiformaceae bacterium]|nr:hypothetical protein [Tepidiformaceae bacterium]
MGWRDIECCEARDTLRMVECEAVGDTTTAVVSRQGEAFEAKCGHDLDVVSGHDAFRIGAAVL